MLCAPDGEADERPLSIEVSAGLDFARIAAPASGDATVAVDPRSAERSIGGGAVGLSAVMGGKIAGCKTIILIEPRADRRALGLSMGAHHAIDPAAGETSEAVRAISPLGADHVLDTSGHVGALQSALQMLAPMGTLGLIGVPPAMDATLSVVIAQAITFGHKVMGIIEGDSVPKDFLPQLVSWTQSGELPVGKMVTTYPFAQINKALHEAHEGSTVKPVLVFD